MTDPQAGPVRRSTINTAADRNAEYLDKLLKANVPHMNPAMRDMLTEAMRGYARTTARDVWSATWNAATDAALKDAPVSGYAVGGPMNPDGTYATWGLPNA